MGSSGGKETGLGRGGTRPMKGKEKAAAVALNGVEKRPRVSTSSGMCWGREGGDRQACRQTRGSQLRMRRLRGDGG